MKELLETTVKEYLDLNSAETDELDGLRALIQQSELADPTAHTNFEGHVTGSIFIVTLGRMVLLLEHKGLGKRLQPGGHVDSTDTSPFEAALRELEEETGIKSSTLTHSSVISGSIRVPFHIEVQSIPDNNGRSEPAHYHYDFQYLAIVDEASEIVIDTTESNGAEWVSWDDFSQMQLFSKQAVKTETLLIGPVSADKSTVE